MSAADIEAHLLECDINKRNESRQVNSIFILGINSPSKVFFFNVHRTDLLGRQQDRLKVDRTT